MPSVTVASVTGMSSASVSVASTVGSMWMSATVMSCEIFGSRIPSVTVDAVTVTSSASRFMSLVGVMMVTVASVSPPSPMVTVLPAMAVPSAWARARL